jgi:hypothetical protein
MQTEKEGIGRSGDMLIIGLIFSLFGIVNTTFLSFGIPFLLIGCVQLLYHAAGK